MDKVLKVIEREENRQATTLQLIPSENFTSRAVRQAVGSVVAHKYSEGQPGKRYYQGNRWVDEIERECQRRALGVFGLDEGEWGVVVQAVTGSVANLAVYSGLLTPGDKIMSLYLYDGGHLSHGWQVSEKHKVSLTSKIFQPVYYHVDQRTGLLDYVSVEKQAQREKPVLVVSGGTAYPRDIDYQRLGEITHSAGAIYLADVAHEAGLIAGGVLNSPFAHADVVTMTTRKTLRGPIGSLIFARHGVVEKIARAVFPGLQGGPMNHQIAGIAVALAEARRLEFRQYSRQVVKNARALAEGLKRRGFRLISGGTDKHLLVVDLTAECGVGGALFAAEALEVAGMVVNKNTFPGDKSTPFYPSGIRIGTPFETTRGLREPEMKQIADWFAQVVGLVAKYRLGDNREARREGVIEFRKEVGRIDELHRIRREVKLLCGRYKLDI